MADTRPTNTARERYAQNREQHVRIVFLVPADEIAAIDEWGFEQGSQSRSETIRTLIRRGLAAAQDAGGRDHG